MYWAVSGDTVVGYMTLAMGSAGMEKQEDLGIDTYGPVPGLTIARLATDKRYERRGVGRLMVSYACTLARIMASDSGCRVVLANSELDAVEFYEKMGFVKFKPRSPSAPSGFWHWLCRRMDSKGMEENEYVPMYFDIGPEAYSGGYNQLQSSLGAPSLAGSRHPTTRFLGVDPGQIVPFRARKVACNRLSIPNAPRTCRFLYHGA